MGKSLRRHKRFQTTKSKVGLQKDRKGKHKLKPQPVQLPGSEQIAEWEEEKTLQANYASLGLAVNPNKIGAKAGERGEIVQIVKLKEDGTPAHPDENDSSDEQEAVRLACGKQRREGKRELPPLTKMQRVYIRALIGKHGDDYGAMARDTKLNEMQHSAGVIKYLCERYDAHPNLLKRDAKTDET